MRILYQAALAGLLLGLCGCATIVKGTTQDIAVDTIPQGGSCTVTRNGFPEAKVTAPGNVNVKRGKEQLSFNCAKPPEFPTETAMTVDSKFNGATFGNILAGGVIGVVVDSSTGANYSYPDKVTVELIAVGASAPVAAATPAAAAPPPAAAGAPTPAANAEPAKAEAAKPAAPATKPDAPKAATPPSGSN